MDVDYPPEAEAFRDRIRGFLAEHLPEGWSGAGALPPDERSAFTHRWRRTLADRGLVAVSWPKEYGGAGLSALEQVVLAEEFARAGAPLGAENDLLGIELLGNTLIALGSEQQKRHFLPRILRGEDLWCQGFSEPEAGSDLAGVRTRAVLDGDEWVINGQKIWTSAGPTANCIFVLARTDPAAPKHQGLSFLLVRMDQPGVEMRPDRQRGRARHFQRGLLHRRAHARGQHRRVAGSRMVDGDDLARVRTRISNHHCGNRLRSGSDAVARARAQTWNAHRPAHPR